MIRRFSAITGSSGVSSRPKSLDGLAPIADRLVADLATLDARLRALKMTPDVLTDSVGSFATQLSRDRLSAGEDRYAQS